MEINVLIIMETQIGVEIMILKDLAQLTFAANVEAVRLIILYKIAHFHRLYFNLETIHQLGRKLYHMVLY